MKKFFTNSSMISIFLLLTIVGNSKEQKLEMSESWSGFPSLKFSPVEVEDFKTNVDNVGIFQNRTKINSRSKRFLNINMFGTLEVGFLLTIPFTIVLPPASNLFNAWKYKRSIRSVEEEQIYYEDDPILQPQIDRISTYFDLIQIPEPGCQRRAICEFSSNPDKYFPIADIFLNQIRDPTLLLYNERKETTPNVHNSTDKYGGLFKLYNNAADSGQSYGEEACHTEFSTKCPFSSEQRLNMPLFQFWKSIEKALDIKFQSKLF